MGCQAIAQANKILLAAAPAISNTIEVIEQNYPALETNLVSLEYRAPEDIDITELVFKHDLPKITRDFSSWAPITPVTGCNPCDDNICGYNWQSMGATGMTANKVAFMYKDYKSDKYCIDKLQYTHQVEEMVKQNVNNLRLWLHYERDINVIQTALVNSAKKSFWTKEQQRVNHADPYTYMAAATQPIKTLSLDILSRQYEILRRTPGAEPLAMIGNNKLFGLTCSQEMINTMIDNDPKLREDLRYSGAMASGFLTDYNFQYTIRGMFLPITIDYPRRFNRVNGEWYEVAPNISIDAGTAGTESVPNPAYFDAEAEEVMFTPKASVKIYYTSNKTTVGSGTEFGKQPSFFNELEWVNIRTDGDPQGKFGYFMSGAKIGISAVRAKSLVATLFARYTGKFLGNFLTYNTACAPVVPTCDDGLSDGGCPCALLASKPMKNMAVATNNWFFTFTTPVAAEVEDEVTITLKNGGYVVGEVINISADGLVLEIQFNASVNISACVFEGLCPVNALACYADVILTSSCDTSSGNFSLILKNPIKAITAEDIITGIRPDGTAVSLEVVSADIINNTWVVVYDGGTLSESAACCDGGFVKVCVPSTTDATCDGCPVVEAIPCGD